MGQWKADGRKRMRMKMCRLPPLHPPLVDTDGQAAAGRGDTVPPLGGTITGRFWCRFISFSFESRLYFSFAFYRGKFSNIINIEI